MYKRELEKYNICTQASVSFQALPPFYEIEAVTFDPETRAAAITFLVSKVKGMATYPVAVTPKLRNYMHDYNETVERELRAITLTNEVLENLTRHHDELIARFAIDIVGTIKNADIYPSWFVEEIATGDLNFEVEKASKTIYLQEYSLKKGIEEITRAIQEKENCIKKANILIAENKSNVDESRALQERMLENPKAFVRFPLFANFRVKKKVAVLKEETEKLGQEIARLELQRDDAERAMELLKLDLAALQDGCEEICAKEREKIEKARERYCRIINKIVPLPYDIADSE